MFWEGYGKVTAGAPNLGLVEGLLVALLCPTKLGVSPKAPQLQQEKAIREPHCR